MKEINIKLLIKLLVGVLVWVMIIITAFGGNAVKINGVPIENYWLSVLITLFVLPALLVLFGIVLHFFTDSILVVFLKVIKSITNKNMVNSAKE